MLRTELGVQKYNNPIRMIGMVLIGFAILANPFVLGRLLSSDGVISSLPFVSTIVFCEILFLSLGCFFVLKSNVCTAFILGIKTKDILLLIVTFLFVFFIGDLILKAMRPPVYESTKYGWTVDANTTETRKIHDRPGHFRTVHIAYFDHGFKRWGDPATRGQKILILGDSFTHMTYVSNGEEWYSYLETAFSQIEFFVYGGGGYGSLQEYMVLDDYIDEINPDLVLWQFTSNDYYNNFYEIDKQLYPRNNFGVRPYLENEKIVYKMPMPFSFLRQYSRIADLLLKNYDDYNKRNIPLSKGSPWPEIGTDAYDVTTNILVKARQRAGDRPFFMFSASQMEEKERVICQNAGIACIPGVRESIDSKEAEGLSVRVVNDGHWNLAGNKFVGEYLVKYLKENLGTSDLFNNGL